MELPARIPGIRERGPFDDGEASDKASLSSASRKSPQDIPSPNQSRVVMLPRGVVALQAASKMLSYASAALDGDTPSLLLGCAKPVGGLQRNVPCPRQ